MLDCYNVVAEMHSTLAKNMVPIERTPLKTISMARLIFTKQLCIPIVYDIPILERGSEREIMFFTLVVVWVTLLMILTTTTGKPLDEHLGDSGIHRTTMYQDISFVNSVCINLTCFISSILQ